MTKKPKLEKFKGTNDDDILIVEEANIKLDGKKGADLAVFSGDIEDYDIDFMGKKNKKIELSDDDGVYELKKVENIQFDGDTPEDVSDDSIFNVETGTLTYVNTSLDPSAQESPGQIFPGSGNPSSDFVVTRNEGDGVELGLSIRYRQGPAVDPVSVDADGSVRFDVNTGAQNTDNGSSGNNANRAAWSFNYSIATGLNGETTDLSDFTFKLFVDVDVTEDTNFRELTMIENPPEFSNETGFFWIDQDSSPTIGDDGGNGNVAQNSENFAFGFIEDFIDADPDLAGLQSYAPNFGEAEFDIRLEAYDTDGDIVASVAVVVDVFDFA